ncbi:glycosyltransferase family 4 protein [Nocardiopsis sp. HNM0947]|uniref:Glycosyltransferase family 4 protein n=1 Tax=Nocardiopsis coralli TaxID=2772213 RepID=A0ABR9P108_9ACTN|nr:glycosyltransferase family 4 protein [Nocardiopsis coralli]
MFVVPEPSAPSGGDVYDRRLAQALAAAGRPVRVVEVPGSWPVPSAADRAGLARALDGAAEGAVVLLDGLVACTAPDVLAAHERRLRLVVLVHLPLALEGGLTPSEASERHTLEHRALGSAARSVATSDWARRHLQEQHGLTRVATVAPGTDPAPPAPGTDGRSHLVCVASLTPRKGHDVLLSALTRLDTEPWHLTCVGPGTGAHADQLRATVAERRWQDRVRFTGPLTGTYLDQARAAADLCVLASRAETYGMAVTESLARAVPVVATQTGGVPEALGRAPDGSRPGILVAPGDPAALAGALHAWCNDPGLREGLRRSARLRRGTLAGWDRAAEQMAAVLDRERWP